MDLLTREQAALEVARPLFSGCLLFWIIVLVVTSLAMAILFPAWTPFEVLR